MENVKYKVFTQSRDQNRADVRRQVRNFLSTLNLDQVISMTEVVNCPNYQYLRLQIF